jgi:hypothetical protein
LIIESTYPEKQATEYAKGEYIVFINERDIPEIYRLMIKTRLETIKNNTYMI